MNYSLELELELLRYLIHTPDQFSQYVGQFSRMFVSNDLIKIFVTEIEGYYKEYHKVPSLSESKIVFDKYLNIRDKNNNLSIVSSNLLELINYIYNPFQVENEQLYQDKLRNLSTFQTLQQEITGLLPQIQDINIYEESKSSIKDSLRRCLLSLEDIDKSSVDNTDIISLLTNKKLFDVSENRVPTGFTLLDRYLGGGLAKKSLGFVEANPGYGKSNFLLNLSYNAYMRGFNVCYVSNELFFEDIQLRILARHLNLNISTLTGSVLDNYSDRLSEFSSRKNFFDVSCWTPNKLSSTSLTGYIDKIYTKHNAYPDLIVLDYFDRMFFDLRDIKNIWMSQAQSLREILSMITDRNIALWSATQPQKDRYDSGALKLGSTGGTRVKIEDASVIVSLNEVNEVTDTTRLFINKNRRGESNTYVNLLYRPAYCYFGDSPLPDIESGNSVKSHSNKKNNTVDQNTSTVNSNTTGLTDVTSVYDIEF